MLWAEGVGLQLKVENHGDTILIRWGNIPEQWQASLLEVYVEETFANRFPEGKPVEILSPKATGWYFIRRRGINMLGLDVRHPEDIGRLDRWTPGEAYTIGLRIIVPDSLTHQTRAHDVFSHVLPFQILLDVPESSKSKPLTRAQARQVLPPSALYFIRNDSFILEHSPAAPPLKASIHSWNERSTDFLLELSSGMIILYQKGPSRPFLLGNSSILAFFLFGIGFLIIILPILFFLMFKFISTIYKRNLEEADTWEEQKQIIYNILNRRFFALPVFFALLHFQNPDLDDSGILFTTLRQKVKKYRLYQQDAVREIVRTLLESGEIEQARLNISTPSVAGTIIHVQGNDNIILKDMQDSHLHLQRHAVPPPPPQRDS